MWRIYFPGTRGLIFVYDASVGDEGTDLGVVPAESKRVLHRLMGDELLRDAKLLVFANKQDLPNAQSEAEVAAALDLHMLYEGKLRWKVQQCCALSGAGLSEGVDWLCTACDLLPPPRLQLRAGLSMCK